ncbi:MAG: ATP-binding cassette domain-containing protein, partial [Xanthobacteraceae bacterium]
REALARDLNGAIAEPGAHERIEGLEHLDKVIDIDQSPIGRTPRSNPATYTGAFTPIRDWFAGLPEAKARGYLPGRFSFNVKGGRCEACQGDGVIKIEMHFLPDVYVTCDVCKGKRYNRETLEVLFRGKSIADVLDMTVEEALEFFKAVPRVREPLKLLHRVGLDYIHVGQQATTLSGGEAQRVKLAKELSKRATGRTLYILDEPTTGLHFHDVAKLLEVLHELVDTGNTVVVIEHNLEVIKTADWIIDLGPEGGDGGGEIVASGTPEDIARAKASYTGAFLKPVLARRAAEPGKKKRIEAAE